MPQHILYPYWQDNQWVFDDEDVGLVAEPFVDGSSEILTALIGSQHIQEAKQYGFALFFSDEPLGSGEVVLDFVGLERGGVRYEVDVGGASMSGWLCPNFWKYFDKAPTTLYVGLIPFGAMK